MASVLSLGYINPDNNYFFSSCLSSGNIRALCGERLLNTEHIAIGDADKLNFDSNYWLERPMDIHATGKQIS